MDLLLALDTQPPRVSLSWGDGPDGPELVRADRDAIRGFVVELLSLASRCSRPAVTGRLLALLGVCVCPVCEAEVSPAESLGLGSTGDAAEIVARIDQRAEGSLISSVDLIRADRDGR